MDLEFNNPADSNQAIPDISVNGIKIEADEIYREIQNHPANSRQEALNAAARALVVKALLIQEAESLDIDSQPQVDEAGNLETTEDAKIRSLIDSQVEVPVASEKECYQYYQNNQQKFTSEPLYEARHILLSVPQGDAEKRLILKEQAKAIIAQLQKDPETFADVARIHSDCPSAQVGGNLGQLSRGSTVKEFEQALLNLEQGTLCSEPVESKYGFHIIALDKKVMGGLQPFSMVHQRIAAWLGAMSWSKAVSQYISILAGKADIQGISIDAATSPLVR